ncbi:MAG: YdcF family protein [Demequinaceae bacterium]|nr:YdcF family protein [Demequinaceae bacterium]
MLGPTRIRRRYRWLVALVVLIPTVVAGPWLVLGIATMGDVYGPGETPRSADAAIVLGTLVNADGSLSPRLEQRVEAGAELFCGGVVDTLIMSGTDSSTTGQNETTVMRDYAITLGVPASAIVLDPLGVDTFTSCQRADEVYHAQSVIVVSQQYHVARATWLCQRAGLETQGYYPAPSPTWWTLRGIAREVGASWKALADVLGGRGE